MKGKLFTLTETTTLITEGRLLVIAAAETLLDKLPNGNWIGGSNPYLLGEAGAIYSEELLYVKDFTDLAVEYDIRRYDESGISNITRDAYDNGLIIAIFPVNSKVLDEFARKSPTYENQFMNPLLGWVCGPAVEKIGTVPAVNYVGHEKFTSQAVALHIKLPPTRIGRIEIVNPYEQGDGDEITFETDGFHVKDCFVNGKRTDFYTYLHKRDDLFLPFVADYAGAKINVAVMLDNENKKVGLFAPVFKDTVYKLAKPVHTDYISYLSNKLKEVGNSKIEYSYSCLYNYFNFALEKKPIPGFVGTFTWGEIGFQLLNVTFVYLVIEDVTG